MTDVIYDKTQRVITNQPVPENYTCFHFDHATMIN